MPAADDRSKRVAIAAAAAAGAGLAALWLARRRRRAREEAALAAKPYRFARSDFGALAFAPLHLDLTIDIAPERVRVLARQTYRYHGAQPTTVLRLSAHDLEIEQVGVFAPHAPLGPPPVGLGAAVPDFVAHVAALRAGAVAPAPFEQREYERELLVTLPRAVSRGDEVAVRTVSVCRPTSNVLEGVYYDYTPDGAPPTMITQCQQYGFQRIVPCVDEMLAKTFYTTRIVADARYNRVISNGDLAPCCADAARGGAAKPLAPLAPELGDAAELAALAADYPADGPARAAYVYYNHVVNMATYLFFLGVGTYDVYSRDVEYPAGDRTIRLELLCLPGVATPSDAAAALGALHDSVLWTYLSCGPELCDHDAARARCYALLAERERLKLADDVPAPGEPGAKPPAARTQREVLRDRARLKDVRAELKRLMGAWGRDGRGYMYTGTVYREIAMENSDYGGMENVGNTTILSSRLTPSKWLDDGGYVYMEGVKIHEYYHNVRRAARSARSARAARFCAPGHAPRARANDVTRAHLSLSRSLSPRRAPPTRRSTARRSRARRRSRSG